MLQRFYVYEIGKKNPYKKLRILKSGKIGSNVYHKLAV